MEFHMNKHVAFLALAAAVALPMTGKAQTYSSRDESVGYVGLQWVTGETRLSRPNVLLGLRQTRTDTDNRVTGGDLTFSYSTEKGVGDAVRLGYLDGKCNLLGTMGFGYSFRKDKALGFFGGVASYGKVTAEVDGAGTVAGALELNTQTCAGDRNLVALPPV
jgi:hypothetical protein